MRRIANLPEFWYDCVMDPSISGHPFLYVCVVCIFLDDQAKRARDAAIKRAALHGIRARYPQERRGDAL